MTADNTGQQTESTDKTKSEKPTAASQKSACENQVGAGVLTPKTGQGQLPSHLDFTPVVAHLKTTDLVTGVTSPGIYNTNLESAIAKAAPAHTADPRSQHPFTFLQKDTVQLAATEKQLQQDSANRAKSKADEQLLHTQVEDLYRDLKNVKDRHLTDDPTYQKDWQTAHTELNNVNADLHTMAQLPSDRTPSGANRQQFS